MYTILQCITDIIFLVIKFKEQVFDMRLTWLYRLNQFHIDCLFISIIDQQKDSSGTIEQSSLGLGVINFFFSLK